MDKMQRPESLDSLRIHLQEETQARKSAEAALEALQKQSKQQRSAFESWAAALEQQVEMNNQTLVTKVRELESVKKQLETIHSLGKGEEKEAWALRQKKFDGELANCELSRKTEREELKKAIAQVELERSEKEAQLKSCRTEMQLLRDSLQTQEASLKSQLASLSTQLASLREEHSTTVVLFTSEKASLEASRTRSESEKNAAFEEIRRLQTTVSLLTTQLKSLQQENSGLQDVVKTQEAGKTKVELDLKRDIETLRQEILCKEREYQTANNEITKFRDQLKVREAETNSLLDEKKLAEAQCERVLECVRCLSEDFRSRLLVESFSPPMERYQRELNEYRTQLGKCRIALSKYEEMIELGSEKLKSLELKVQARERESEVLKHALRSHKLPVPTIPESSGLADEVRSSIASRHSKKLQVANDPCACTTF